MHTHFEFSNCPGFPNCPLRIPLPNGGQLEWTKCSKISIVDIHLDRTQISHVQLKSILHIRLLCCLIDLHNGCVSKI